MKKLSILFIGLVLLTSCGGNEPTVDELIATGDTKAIAAKKTALNTQKAEISKSIQQIEAYLKENGDQAINAQVSTIVVKDTLFNHYIELQGNVDTKQNITIMPEMAGLLTQVYVKEGQQVTAGQALAKIDDGGLSQQIQQMQVQEQLAKTTFERQNRLWEQKIGSEIQYLQAKANYEAAQNQLEQAKKQMGKFTIRAPFSGVIDDVINRNGFLFGFLAFTLRYFFFFSANFTRYGPKNSTTVSNFKWCIQIFTGS